MSENKFHVGDEVVFVNSEMHEESPEFYPQVGTVGTVVEAVRDFSSFDFKIQWPDGSTSCSDEWLVNYKWVEPLCPDQGEFEKSDLSISFLLDDEVGV